MPRPVTERQAWEQERDALPARIASYQRELDATPADSKERRERLWWQIRRHQMRIAELEKRLSRTAEG